MRTKVVLTLTVFLIAASAMAASAPAVQAHLAQTTPSRDMFMFRGPMSIEYQLSITNPTDQPLTLKRISLRTEGPGAYSLRAPDSPINIVIAPNATSSINLSTWASARGGFMRSSEPVNLRVQLWFDGPNKKGFMKQFVESLPQM